LNTAATHNEERLHGLDALRASAMLLGLVLHASIPFMNAPFHWVARQSSGSWVFDILFTAIHSFRMPLFFLLSGFFSHLLCARKGWFGFLGHRALHIGIPFFIGMLTLVPLIIWIFIWKSQVDLPVGSAIRLLDIPTFHLWFLEVLLIFYALAGLLSLAGRFMPGFMIFVDRAVNRGLVRGWPVAFLLPPAMACLWPGSPGSWLHDGDRLLPEPRVLAFYFLFFAMGWVIHRLPTAREILQQRFRPFLLVGLTGLLLVVSLHIGLLSGQLHESLLVRVVGFSASTACAWFFSLGLVGLFLALVQSYHPAVRYLADASYWVYLIHLPVMMLLQEELYSWPIPFFLKFLLTLLTTTIVGFASYALFVRYTLIGSILNGSRKRMPSVQPIANK
jgi:peptidoglycan/LPS O-acetylase OafA/YrhL